MSNSTNVTYGNTTLTFSISDPVPWNVSDQVSIFFDEGVLYSNATVKSTHQNQTTFWTLTVFDPPMIVNATTAQPQTTARAMTSMPTETSGHPVTSMMATGQTNPTNTTATTSSPVTVGESSPTRSAQWGMGLGITFITLIVVGEVIYFKYCYSDYGRSGSYYTWTTTTTATCGKCSFGPFFFIFSFTNLSFILFMLKYTKHFAFNARDRTISSWWLLILDITLDQSRSASACSSADRRTYKYVSIVNRVYLFIHCIRSISIRWFSELYSLLVLLA